MKSLKNILNEALFRGSDYDPHENGDFKKAKLLTILDTLGGRVELKQDKHTQGPTPYPELEVTLNNEKIPYTLDTKHLEELLRLAHYIQDSEPLIQRFYITIHGSAVLNIDKNIDFHDSIIRCAYFNQANCLTTNLEKPSITVKNVRLQALDTCYFNINTKCVFENITFWNYLMFIGGIPVFKKGCVFKDVKSVVIDEIVEPLTSEFYGIIDKTQRTSWDSPSGDEHSKFLYNYKALKLIHKHIPNLIFSDSLFLRLHKTKRIYVCFTKRMKQPSFGLNKSIGTTKLYTPISDGGLTIVIDPEFTRGDYPIH